MKVITCTGYYGTGSSAITDLLSEYENIVCKGDLEIRFLHDIYGVRDLEYYLIENPNRHNSSQMLKMFKKNCEFLAKFLFYKKYEKYFDNNFMYYTEQYIEDLIMFTYEGKCHYDVVFKGKVFYFLDRFIKKIFNIFKRILPFIHSEHYVDLVGKAYAYGTVTDKSKFYEITKKYTNNLFFSIAKGNDIFIDQLVAPNNLSYFMNYVDDLKIILVDRDPRDIYILEKYIWKGHVVPTKSVELFCEWFKWTRDMTTKEDLRYCYKVQFEDLIYKYDNTVKKIEKFIGLDSAKHINKFNKFVPEISKKNTKLWVNYPSEKRAIKEIETRLPDNIYKYDDEVN